MKLKALLFASAVFFISCSNDKKTTETARQASTLKSDMLIQSVAHKPFSRPDSNEELSLTIYGENLLYGTATFKVTNTKGEEVYCESFPSKDLIQSDYKTANSSLQEAHIRDVAEGYFVDFQSIYEKQNSSYVGL